MEDGGREDCGLVGEGLRRLGIGGRRRSGGQQMLRIRGRRMLRLLLILRREQVRLVLMVICGVDTIVIHAGMGSCKAVRGRQARRSRARRM